MAKNGRNGVRTFLVVIIMIGAPIASVAGSVTPNDTLWNDMWNVRRVDADDAWDLDNNNKYSNMGSNSVVIAVIDTGLDWDTNPNNRHEDFAVDMVWTNPREVTDDGNNDGYPGVGDFDDDGDGLIDEDSDGDSRYLADGVTVNPEWDDDMDNDDDENGYEDDFYGWNFYDDDNDISDEGEECAWWSVDHGTMVTSVISAKVNNGKGISGISPKIKIMVIKMSGDSGVLTSAQMEACFVEGINYAINNGADVISMSWRWPDGDQWPDGGVFDTEFQQAYNNGIFLCAASGNRGSRF